jgi:hypothetical protein
MTQVINPAKLKAAAEQLEWVLKQYPDSDDVQGLLHALAPLIDDARSGKILEPLERIPGEYNHADGRYIPYKNPDVGDAYSAFAIEIEGGLTEEDEQRLARMDAMRKAMMGRPQS